MLFQLEPHDHQQDVSSVLVETKVVSINLRIDMGTETGKMAATHAYLLNQLKVMDDPTDAIIYDPSTSNKIERW